MSGRERAVLESMEGVQSPPIWIEYGVPFIYVAVPPPSPLLSVFMRLAEVPPIKRAQFLRTDECTEVDGHMVIIYRQKELPR